MDEVVAQAIAEDLLKARAERRTIPPWSDRCSITMKDAYRIQGIVTTARIGRGERVIGWKLGYTSPAMRQQMGVDEPNFGPLTDAMIVSDGGTAGSSLTQPRVEPEIGFIVRHRLSGGDITAEEALRHTERAIACLEIVDSVYADYRFRIEDNTADGSSAAQVVVGPDLPAGTDLAAMPVIFERNDEEVGSATGAAAMGHPGEALAWLARRQPLRPGDLVITGGLTAAVPLRPGDVLTARFGTALSVSVRGGHPNVEPPSRRNSPEAP